MCFGGGGGGTPAPTTPTPQAATVIQQNPNELANAQRLARGGSLLINKAGAQKATTAGAGLQIG